MKRMRLAVECAAGGRSPRKVLSFPITDEMAEHMKSLFAARREDAERGEENEDDTKGFVCEGSRSVRIYMSLVDADGKF